MKIAIIRQRYVAHGGAENVILKFVEDLVNRGCKVHIFASRWDVKAGSQPRVVLHRVPIIGGGSFLKLISFAFFCWYKIRNETFDVIYSFERTLCQDIYRAGDGCHREWLNQRKKRLSVWRKIILIFNPFHRATLFIEKRIYAGKRTKKIVANSRRGKEEIIRHYGTPPEKIEVIYNGVDLERFHPANKERYRNNIRSHFGIDEKEFVILFVGSGFERKGLRFLIEAAGLLKRRCLLPSFKILVVGKGKAKGYFRLARQAGIEKDLYFAGTFEKIDQIYAAGDLLVLPTLYDPFANVCLESMASALPIITTQINGASELLTGPLTQLVLEEAGDIKGLANRILELADQHCRAEFGRLCREVAERFSERYHCDRMISLYEMIPSKTG